MKKKFKINKPLKNYPVGANVNLDVDKEGIPTNMYWRRRYMDSKKDGCIKLCECKPTVNRVEEVKTQLKETPLEFKKK